MSTATFDLTDEQQEALEGVTYGIRHGRREWKVGGFAGTGKTSWIKTFIGTVPRVAVCAYTGQAAQVLHQRGVPASTIHRLIYRREHQENGGYRFVLNLPVFCDVIVCDEASMVTKTIHDDFLRTNKPLVFVGDHGQLPPIGGTFNLMEDPDYTFETLHRNAGEIARFAEHLRRDEPSHTFHLGQHGPQQVHFLRARDLDGELLTKADMTIVAFNNTRVGYNEVARDHLGRTELIEVGDRIMVLRNHPGYEIFNGQQGTVRAVDLQERHVTFEVNGVLYEEIPFDPFQFGNEQRPKSDFKFTDPIPFDYAYASTAHKSQGSQYPLVAVHEQKCKHWEHRRWAYTAASRAQQHLLWVPARGW